ncbi:hypothetical protein [Paenibacillus sp. J2TS4]|uniref:hypothetical protein n=1 Tax=Paenibacillus sp. J2TS4 TaxID=2807194 RepID=UPI001B275029|nr:hypothetical protein [Paenibacillus sp. J2TS4]GIP36451.1 hypothetical protein J2TS4_56610 [Paenibacillus sp. J2TS4]
MSKSRIVIALLAVVIIAGGGALLWKGGWNPAADPAAEPAAGPADTPQSIPEDPQSTGHRKSTRSDPSVWAGNRESLRFVKADEKRS